MQNAPCRVIAVSDVKQIIVSADPSEGAIVLFEVPGAANLELKIPAIAFAKLEGLLAKASATQAKLNRPQ